MSIALVKHYASIFFEIPNSINIAKGTRDPKVEFSLPK